MNNHKRQLSQLGDILKRLRGEPESVPEPAAEPAPQAKKPATRPAIRGPQTFLIVGLGNHGPKYAMNRHNVGFMLADRLADRLGTSFRRVQNQALVTDGRRDDHKIILAKPQTYMNLSGTAAVPLLRFFKIPAENMLVLYDEMDIPLSSLRIRKQGGAGGHNGMKSIIQHLGHQDFPRMRIGISRPPGRIPPPSYLLQDFKQPELDELDSILDTAADAVFTFVTNGIDKAMNQYNGEV
jgi:PTH1 family peptidyl-tRNA hydrolase